MKLSVPKRHIGKKLYTEIWKDIVGYEGKYMISNIGRVKSLNYERTGKEKILKPCKTKRGYLQVTLCKDGKCKKYSIHRLVALHFVDGYFEGAEIDHINCVRDDNRAENLRWVTHKGNNNNELTRKHNSEAKQGENNPMYGKCEPVYCLELDKSYPNANQCAKELGLWASNIRAVCKGKLKQTKGYHFYYVENILYKN